MGILNWLVGESVEAPGIALGRNDRIDMAESDYRCSDYRDYLKRRREIADNTAKRLEAQYSNAEKRASSVCEAYAEGLAERERRLSDAEEAFLSRRKVVIAALRDSNCGSMADVIARETMVRRAK